MWNLDKGRRWTHAAPVAALTVALTLLAGCGASSEPTTEAGAGGAEPASLTIAVQPIPDFAPVWVAQEQGYFAQHGLRVEIVPGASSSSGQVPLVLGGNADLAATTATAALQAAAQGLPIKLVAGLTDFATSAENDPTGLVVAPGSRITTYADLEGATVAVTGLKSVTQAGVEAAVAKDGGDPAKVDFIQAPLPNIPTLVAEGKVDAGFLIDPLLTPALAKGLKLLGHPFPDVSPGLPATSVIASAELSGSDVLDRFRAALAQGAEYANAHPDAVKNLIAQHSKIPGELLKPAALPTFTAQIDRAALANEVDMLVRYGALEKSVDVNAVLATG